MQENQPLVPIADSLQTTEVQPAVDNRPKANSFLVILLSILLFISCIIVGFFAYQTQKLAKELTAYSVQITQTPTPEPTYEPGTEPEPVPLEILTKDWKTFNNPREFPVSFKYPIDTNISVKSFEESSNIFFSSRPINFPEAWGGPLTEMEANFLYKDTQNFKSYEERIEALKSGLVSSSIKEESIITGTIKGKIISGKNVPGYMEGLETIVAMFDTPKGPVSFYYFGNGFNNITPKISEETFRQIVKTVK